MGNVHGWIVDNVFLLGLVGIIEEVKQQYTVSNLK
jgi:hypothetical protein